MSHKNVGLSAQSAAYLFGIGWFLPFCVYTLWAHGIRPASLSATAHFTSDSFAWLWGLIVAHPIELTLFFQLAIGCLFIVGSRTLSWSTIGFRRTSTVWFFVAIAGIVSSYVFSGLLQAIFQVPGIGGVHVEASGGPNLLHLIGQLLSALLTIGLATAIIEEVAFRGVLYGWLRTNVGPNAGIVLSALIFSLFHLRFINPGGLLGISATLQVMLAGIALAFLYEKSGSLWPPIYFHGVNNIIGILQALSPR